ncbi:uncharacterized protein LOC141720241 [Apium graveolens]|uniref:uncharacterized protein LOC141720241 n=1 Tax=Apium graveolens TaxID=4045 RepID=UPI003D79D237
MSSYESDESIHTSQASCSTPANFEGDEDPMYIYGANQLDMYQTEAIIGSAEGTNIYRGKFHQVGCSEVLTVAYRRVNLEPVHYYNFVIQNKKQRRIRNPHLVALKEEVNDRGRMWLVFEYVGPSLRGMYLQGATLPVLAYALYITVDALVSIHQNKLVHGQVDLGHIYMQTNHPFDNKLGFGATVYEDLEALKAEPNFLPSNYTCTWAAAPEVYYENNLHTSASDIWQVGITALELALGKLWVQNRDELNTLIIGATAVWEHGLFANADFQSFLKDCLHQDPDMRPTSEQLIHHEFFINSIK